MQKEKRTHVDHTHRHRRLAKSKTSPSPPATNAREHIPPSMRRSAAPSNAAIPRYHGARNLSTRSQLLVVCI